MRSLQPGRPRGASAGRLQGPDCHPALCLPTDVSRCVAERKYTQEQARRELRNEKKEARKEKKEEKKAKLAADWDGLKEKIKKD